MRLRAVLGVFAVLLAACGSSAAGTGATSSGTQSSGGTHTNGGTQTTTGTAAGGVVCGPSQARTLAASTQARVYVSRSKVYGCARGATRSRLLGQSSTCLGRQPLISPVAVKGVLAGYGSETCGVDTGTATVIVQRLTDGTVVTQRRASTAVTGPESHVTVTALVMAGDGDVAWIAVASSIIGSRHAIQVRAFDHRGARMLDHGNAIDSAHLHLRNAKVSWKHGPNVRSASLD